MYELKIKSFISDGSMVINHDHSNFMEEREGGEMKSFYVNKA